MQPNKQTWAFVTCSSLSKLIRSCLNIDGVIAYSQEAVDADHVPVHAGAAASDIFDRSDSLIGIVVDIQANYLNASLAGRLVKAVPRELQR